MLKSRPECAAPCATCPWRRENHGKPHEDGWYDPDNLKRLWNGLREGEAMICHATDPKAVEYGGTKEVAPGHERMCVGALALVQRHTHALEAVLKENPNCGKKMYPLYKKKAGRTAMTQHGFIAHAERIVFSAFSPTPMPKTLTDCGTIDVPWPDPIVNGGTP